MNFLLRCAAVLAMLSLMLAASHIDALMEVEGEWCYEDGGPYVCGTDAHYAAVCEREQGRPCSDEELFGPVEDAQDWDNVPEVS